MGLKEMMVLDLVNVYQVTVVQTGTDCSSLLPTNKSEGGSYKDTRGGFPTRRQWAMGTPTGGCCGHKKFTQV